MKSIRCADLSGSMCSFVAAGKTGAEIKKKLEEHAMMTHPQMMKKLNRGQKAAMTRKLNKMLG